METTPTPELKRLIFVTAALEGIMASTAKTIVEEASKEPHPLIAGKKAMQSMAAFAWGMADAMLDQENNFN